MKRRNYREAQARVKSREGDLIHAAIRVGETWPKTDLWPYLRAVELLSAAALDYAVAVRKGRR